MKKLIIIHLLLFFTLLGTTQQLIDIYKKGTVQLVADNTFAQDNDWNKIFETYYDTMMQKHIGKRKSLIVQSDGSVVVSHAYKNYYTRFAPNGKFIEEFGIKNSKGKRFKKSKPINGILNNEIFFTGLDNMGICNCFGLNGTFKKSLTLDYMTRQMIALPNGKIAVVGWVIWAEKFRDFVAIVDYETNDEKIIWEHYTDRCEKNTSCKMFNYQYEFEKRGSFSFTTMPFSKSTGVALPPVLSTIDNKLIVAIPTTGEIKSYDLEGNLLASDKIDWSSNFVSIEEQREMQQKAIDKLKKKKLVFSTDWADEEETKTAIKQITSEMEADLAKISEPIPIPYFSTILKDSDDNLLFFEFPKEENANVFNVWIYKDKGTFICKSSFESKDYELQINSDKMVFHDGYIYALQNKKEAKGVPLRLVRFQLK